MRRIHTKSKIKNSNRVSKNSVYCFLPQSSNKKSVPSGKIVSNETNFPNSKSTNLLCTFSLSKDYRLNLVTFNPDFKDFSDREYFIQWGEESSKLVR
jgi:hypothetical protein